MRANLDISPCNLDEAHTFLDQVHRHQCRAWSTCAVDTASCMGLVALRLRRSYIGIELNPEYVAISERRIREDAPLFLQGGSE